MPGTVYRFKAEVLAALGGDLRYYDTTLAGNFSLVVPDKRGLIHLDPDWLVEVRPPSIDDPVDWPFEASDGRGRFMRLYDMGGEYTTARVGYLTSEWGFDLDADELLRLAQAAWQRYQAITGGAK